MRRGRAHCTHAGTFCTSSAARLVARRRLPLVRARCWDLVVRIRPTPEVQSDLTRRRARLFGGAPWHIACRGLPLVCGRLAHAITWRPSLARWYVANRRLPPCSRSHPSVRSSVSRLDRGAFAGRSGAGHGCRSCAAAARTKTSVHRRTGLASAFRLALRPLFELLWHVPRGRYPRFARRRGGLLAVGLGTAGRHPML